MNRNPKMNKKGNEHPAWKGGKPHCICGKKLADYTSKYCKSCNNKDRWSNPDYKKMVSNKISLRKIENGNFKNEKNPKWKGGVTPLRKLVRGCFNYRQWRSDIFTRDDYTCQICFKRGGDLEADHFPKKFSDIMDGCILITLDEALSCEELWNINNGRTLCVNCHRKTF